jgi:hypothetical protein
MKILTVIMFALLILGTGINYAPMFKFKSRSFRVGLLIGTTVQIYCLIWLIEYLFYK